MEGVASVKGSLSVIKIKPFGSGMVSSQLPSHLRCSLQLWQAGVPPRRNFAWQCPCRSENNVLQNKQSAQDRQPCNYSNANPSGMAARENSLAEKQPKNMFKYTSHWSVLGTLLSQWDCYLVKASLLYSTITEMTVQWTYCTCEDNARGSIIFDWMAPWDLQSCNFNHWPNVWSHWRIKNDGENKGCGERSSQPGRGLTHPFFLLMPEDRVLWTMFLAEDSTGLKIRLLLFS